MPVKVGDRITVAATSTIAAGRAGTVETILRQQPLRVQVRWDDGHTTVIAPADGATSIISASTSRNQTKSRQVAKRPTQ